MIKTNQTLPAALVALTLSNPSAYAQMPRLLPAKAPMKSSL